MTYREIPFWRFALAVGIVGLPLLFLQREAPRWAWGYVVLILLGFLVVNSRGVGRFAAFASKELKGA